MTEPDELRLLVREVLRDLLPAVLPALAGRSAAGATPVAEPVVEQVAVGADGDLTAFALRILDLATDPERSADLRAGRLRFRLDPATARTEAPAEPAEPAVAAVVPPETVHRHEKGAVTERHVAAAAAAGARLVLGPRAVLTPLARERVRASGLAVERED
ncbi:hypothetical protein IMZ11_33235 [Microtetraspora sp. AC03309]|uniref:hypothetical protein n=1 Tax=Microtetraspora sp. AC03309 TaxID=2779376 RepID=UPI001E593B3F|nr:hypothetical protein [Microtetraspora sp. AC03309]MCC5580495.1 hypothetical protein [Microtetraspora sp. AC03309]